MFVALKGENFDANTFAAEALEKGAAFAIVDDPDVEKDGRFLLTTDSLKALQDLATYHRRQLQIPFMGITGTNGKTTTKELVCSVLSQHYKAFATQGNLNNHIGVPLTILSIGRDTEIAIIEMGANHQNEIGFLCGIAQPTHGLITNVGKAHLEGFGGFEGVKIAKGELYRYLAETGGVAFVNQDNTHLMEMSRRHRLKDIIYYGTRPENFVTGTLAESSPLQIDWKKDAAASSVTSNLTGIYNFENILSAITVGCYFNLSKEEINNGISTYFPTNNRSQIKTTEKNTVICDYYNANPSSMGVALENLASITGDNKAFILGDMFELGDDSESEHKAIVEKGLQLPAARKIFIGNEFFKLRKEPGEFYR
ncbi:MAG TPA: UDP-N-acetylmuramoyl-tripeptide--D-alanyl-D-alanine ligase, partial [Sphingobacteriaceae bacterium]